MMDLEPCPFCGKPVYVIYNSFDNAFKFYHKDAEDAVHCPILEPIVIDRLENMSLAEAAANWNRCGKYNS